MYNRIPMKNRHYKLAGILAVCGVIFGLGWYFLSGDAQNSGTSLGTSSVQVPGAKKTYDINRTLSFPILNNKGDEVSKITYLVEKAELRDEIIVQGRKASSVEGRTFLVITLKLTNSLDTDIEINTRDYVRLQINGSNEYLAADIHNDPVQVAAIATKSTRIAFPIDDNLNQTLALRVGEIKGEKQEIPLEFK